ncbi:hypothetical protein MKW92_009728, partial [Papaver armeniacum]
EAKSCPKATPEMMKKINDKKKEKIEKQANRERIDRIYNEDMSIILEESDDEVVAMESMETKKKKLKMSDVRGALDLLFKSDPQKAKQKSIKEFQPAKEQLKLEAWDAIRAWQTEAGIPFNAFRCPSFKEMIYKIGEYGRAMPPPSYRQLRTNIFYNQLNEIKKFVESFKEHCEDGHRQMETVSSNEFWENVTFSCQVLGPLAEVVRMVDTERKSFIGYIYEAVTRCKEENLKRS